jgi:predicted CoA-binding protein
MVSRATIDEVLSHKRVALVGVSRSGKKFGNAVLKELVPKGYAVRPVHPEAQELGGLPCVRSLAELAGEVEAAVLVTPPAETEKLVQEAAAAGIRNVWIQQGAESEAALRFCEEQGLCAVHGECILMFAEPAGVPHRIHRWFRKVFGRMPR